MVPSRTWSSQGKSRIRHFDESGLHVVWLLQPVPHKVQRLQPSFLPLFGGLQQPSWTSFDSRLPAFSRALSVNINKRMWKVCISDYVFDCATVDYLRGWVQSIKGHLWLGQANCVSSIKCWSPLWIRHFIVNVVFSIEKYHCNVFTICIFKASKKSSVSPYWDVCHNPQYGGFQDFIDGWSN